jgi:hypothetical protein
MSRKMYLPFTIKVYVNKVVHMSITARFQKRLNLVHSYLVLNILYFSS